MLNNLAAFCWEEGNRMILECGQMILKFILVKLTNEGWCMFFFLNYNLYSSQ